MKLPELQNSEKYVGLYVVDFGEHTGVGFTAQEVTEILESEKYRDCRVYKIHRAYPNGGLELKGISHQTFHLEAGMFFYSRELETARNDFQKLISLANHSKPPCRAKLHLAEYNEKKFAAALIYPAEYDDEVSSWLLDEDYKTTGAAEGGTGAVQRYYDAKVKVLERKQIYGKEQSESRSGEALLANLKKTVQR